MKHDRAHLDERNERRERTVLILGTAIGVTALGVVGLRHSPWLAAKVVGTSMAGKVLNGARG